METWDTINQPQHTLRAISKMAVSWFVLEELFDDNLLQELFKQPNDEALLLLIAASLRSNGHVLVRNYYEITIPNYSIEDFRSHFRMSRHTVTVIVNLLSVHDDTPQVSTNGGKEPVELRKQILLTL